MHQGRSEAIKVPYWAATESHWDQHTINHCSSHGKLRPDSQGKVPSDLISADLVHVAKMVAKAPPS